MKLSKQELKEIVKECLIEILSEGLVSSSNIRESSRSNTSKSSQLMSMLNEKKSFSMNKSIENRQPQQRQNRQIGNEVVQAAKMAAGKDNVMADILADTAKTTFKESAGHLVSGENIDLSESNSPLTSQPTHGNDAVSLAVANSTPEDLFGDEMMDRWANLAFSGK